MVHPIWQHHGTEWSSASCRKARTLERCRKYSGEKILVNLITIINRHVPAAIDGFLHENPVAGFGALIPVRGDDLPQVVRRRLSLFCVSVLN